MDLEEKGMVVASDFDLLLQGIGADFARACISNVCVAKELCRNGLGYLLVAQSKMVAEDWGSPYVAISKIGTSHLPSDATYHYGLTNQAN